MKKDKVKLLNNLTKDLLVHRKKAINRNINSTFAKKVLKDLLVSPATFQNFDLSKPEILKDTDGQIIVPIKNGVPDLTVYTKDAWDEKEKQASFHDNEDVNERFDEIVLRPYNYTEFHAKIWLKHLFKLRNRFESISNKSLDNLTVLNCGCGGGFEAQFFAEQGARVVGFDISQLRAEAAATRFALHGLEGFFYRGDASILPFLDNTFDIVIYHDSLHHVPIEEIPKALKEARRVSKKYIILSEAHDSPIRMLLESVGLSISIEASGNYTFRFKKSLLEFWCYRFGMDLKLYETSFDRREHRPKLYDKPVIGPFVYYVLILIGKVFKKMGNEALIILEKTTEIKYRK